MQNEGNYKHRQKQEENPVWASNETELFLSNLIPMTTYESKYCCKCFVLFLFFSLRNAHDSICLILSLLTPIDSPISCSVFILPSSIPNLKLMTCFSLGLRVFSTFFRSCFMNCFINRSSDVSASGFAITSCKRSHTNRSAKTNTPQVRYLRQNNV